MALTEQEQQSLQRLCEIFDIPISHTSENPEHALGIVAALYAYPSISDKHEKHRHRDAILQETARIWTIESRFFGAVQSSIAMMIHMPHYYVERYKSNEELLSEFRHQLFAVFILGVIGVGGLPAALAGSIKGGATQSIKTGSVRQGLQAAKSRLLLGAGSGMLEAAVVRWGAAAGIWAAVFVAAMVVAHGVMLENLEEIRSEIARRYASGEATEEEYEKIQNQAFSEIISQGIAPYWK